MGGWVEVNVAKKKKTPSPLTVAWTHDRDVRAQGVGSKDLRPDIAYSRLIKKGSDS